MPSDADRARRLALNEARFREINQELVAGLEGVVADGERIEFVCECSQLECRQTLSLTPEQYRAVRLSPLRFMLVPGHERPEIERVVEQHAGHLVVQKMGPGVDVARERA